MLRKFISVFVAVIMVGTALLSGCSSEPENSGDKDVKTDANSSDPVKITILTNYLPDSPRDAVMQKILEEKFGIKFNMVGFSGDQAVQKKNLYLTSGEDWDILMDDNFSFYKPFKKNNMLVDLTSYINKSPNLKNSFTPEMTDDMVEQDGKVYSIPIMDNPAIPCIMVRKDYMQKLGLGSLEGKKDITWDELENLIDNLINKDPDGDGKKDTYGLTASWSTEMGLYNAWCEAPFMHPWYDVKDKMVLNHWIATDPQAVVYIAVMRYWFKKGYLHPEYFTMNNSQINTGFANGSAPISHTILGRELTVKGFEGKRCYLYPPKGPIGQSASVQFKAYARWLINAKSKPLVAEKFFEYLDWQSTREGFDYCFYGEKGKDYELEGDLVKKLEVENEDDEYYSGWALYKSPKLLRMDTLSASLPSYIKQMEEVSNGQYPISNVGLLSSTKFFSRLLDEKYFTDGRDPEVNKYVLDNYTKFITTDIPIEKWQEVRLKYLELIGDFGPNLYKAAMDMGLENDKNIGPSTFKNFNDLKSYADKNYQVFKQVMERVGQNPEAVMKSYGYVKTGEVWSQK